MVLHAESCWVTGQVNHGARPLRNAQVHICEVDRVSWVLELVPAELDRLSGELARLLQRQATRPNLLSAPAPLSLVSADAEPTRAECDRARALVALRRDDAGARRAALVEYADVLLPHLSLSSRWWRSRCEELGMATTNARGQFNFLIPHTCAGDRPDLYLWVETLVDGERRVIHRPPVDQHVHWGYESAEALRIAVSDDALAATPNAPVKTRRRRFLMPPASRAQAQGEITRSLN